MTLVLELPPELEQRLTREAKEQGVPTADYVLQLLELYRRPTDKEFKKAAGYVLQKNAELYRRLA